MRALRLSAILALLFSSFASASAITASGYFNHDDDLQYFLYSVPNTVGVHVETTSFADLVHTGFVPVLSLFDPLGNLVNFNDGYSTFSDASLDYVSGAGDIYTIVLSEHDNSPAGSLLTDGFTRDGQGDFTTLISGFPGPFRDPGGDQLTGYWSVTFTSADPQLVVVVLPEPGPLWMAMAGVLLMVFGRRGFHRAGN